MAQEDVLELKALRDFKRVLFGKIKGSLEVPEADRGRITYGEDGWINGVERWLNRRNVPLFTHPPCISDISQGGLGDCYFLASLATATEGSPDFVEKHMTDNGDGSVLQTQWKQI